MIRKAPAAVRRRWGFLWGFLWGRRPACPLLVCACCSPCCLSVPQFCCYNSQQSQPQRAKRGAAVLPRLPRPAPDPRVQLPGHLPHFCRAYLSRPSPTRPHTLTSHALRSHTPCRLPRWPLVLLQCWQSSPSSPGSPLPAPALTHPSSHPQHLTEPAPGVLRDSWTEQHANDSQRPPTQPLCCCSRPAQPLLEPRAHHSAACPCRSSLLQRKQTGVDVAGGGPACLRVAWPRPPAPAGCRCTLSPLLAPTTRSSTRSVLSLPRDPPLALPNATRPVPVPPHHHLHPPPVVRGAALLVLDSLHRTTQQRPCRTLAKAGAARCAAPAPTLSRAPHQTHGPPSCRTAAAHSASPAAGQLPLTHPSCRRPGRSRRHRPHPRCPTRPHNRRCRCRRRRQRPPLARRLLRWRR